jgi:hypothetical protein
VALLKEALVTPPKVLTLTGPPVLLPSIRNWIVPVGVPAPGAAAATVAVRVTLLPHADGLSEDVTTVVLPALATVCPRDAVLAWKLLSPA